MFAYCRNNPITRTDISGTEDQIAYNDGELLTSDELEQHATGGGLAVTAAVSGAAACYMAAYVSVQSEGKAISFSLKKWQSQDSYIVYFLCAKDDPNHSIIYVGRVKSSNFAARMSYHKTKGREYVFSFDELDYNTCRALEQAGMVFFHTINREKSINNQIRGISPTNSKRHIYMAALWEFINSPGYPQEANIPLSFLLNLTENTFLNGAI